MRVGILEAGQELTARPREFAPKAYAKRQAGRGLLVKLTASLYRRVSPEEARSLEPGKWVDVPDLEAAKCVRAFGRSQGWKMVQRKDASAVRVWRLK